MPDNFTNDTAELLIRYMDGELNQSETQTVEDLLQNDAAAQEQYQFFVAARRSVRSEGMRQKVAGIQRSYLAERTKEGSKPLVRKKSSSFFSPFMNVAAILLFLLVGYGTFQYLATTNQSVYNDAYIAYELPVSRGSETASPIDELYNKGDYKSVINTYNATQQKSQKDAFIAGLSYLHLNETSNAVKAFQQVEAFNAGSEKKRYVQETDYYLMLAYLKTGNISNAEKKLETIRADKNHLFYEKAAKISHTKLLILKWKDK